jgi:hypothetical protein
MLAWASISLAVMHNKISFIVVRLHAGRKCIGHVVDIFETNGRIKRYHRLRNGIGLAVFPTREEAIRAADALCL